MCGNCPKIVESWTIVLSWGSKDDGNKAGFQDLRYTGNKLTLSP